MIEQWDQAVALRFLTKAMRRDGMPEKITSDGSEANAAAIKRYDKGYGIVEISVGCDGRNPVPQLIDQVRTAEAASATAFWVSSPLFLRDPFTMAGAVLTATTRARVTLLGLSPYVLHPVHMAMAAATLDELAPGRVMLLRLSRFRVYGASHARRHCSWLIDSARTCRIAPRSSWLCPA